jgi:predicted nucleic acid-binding protein
MFIIIDLIVKNVMQSKVFVDSNIWLYLFLHENKEKFKIVEKYFQNNSDSIFVITYQVINEVSNILLKNSFNEMEIKEIIYHLFKVCTLQDFSKEILFTASSVREKYSFSFWDSIIIGSALFSKCDTIISEDMQNGLIVNNTLLIKNIF